MADSEGIGKYPPLQPYFTGKVPTLEPGCIGKLRTLEPGCIAKVPTLATVLFIEKRSLTDRQCAGPCRPDAHLQLQHLDVPLEAARLLHRPQQLCVPLPQGLHLQGQQGRAGLWVAGLWGAWLPRPGLAFKFAFKNPNPPVGGRGSRS